MSKFCAEVKRVTVRLLPWSDEDRRWGPPVAGFPGFTEPWGAHLQPKEGPNHGPILLSISYLQLQEAVTRRKGSFYRSKLKDQLLSSIEFESLCQFCPFPPPPPSRRLRSLGLVGCWFQATADSGSINTSTTKLSPYNGREASWSVEGKSIGDWNRFFLEPRGSHHPQHLEYF